MWSQLLKVLLASQDLHSSILQYLENGSTLLDGSITRFKGHSAAPTSYIITSPLFLKCATVVICFLNEVFYFPGLLNQNVTWIVSSSILISQSAPVLMKHKHYQLFVCITGYVNRHGLLIGLYIGGCAIHSITYFTCHDRVIAFLGSLRNLRGME